MIDYNNMLYEDYKKLLDQIEKYNKQFLYKSPLEEIRLRYSGNIGSKDLSIIIAHNEILTKTIRISNIPPIEIKRDAIIGLALLDYKEMADYIYNKKFKDTPKEHTSQVKKTILEEIKGMIDFESFKHYKQPQLKKAILEARNDMIKGYIRSKK